MSVGGGGSGRDGFSEDKTGRGGFRRVVGGGAGRGHVINESSGLNPNRIRGFVSNRGQGRLETPSLNHMRAQQGAIVAKFFTFFKRKSTLVVEMYETAFYKQKPNWERIAEFVYSDLCKNEDQRRAVKDV